MKVQKFIGLLHRSMFFKESIKNKMQVPLTKKFLIFNGSRTDLYYFVFIDKFAIISWIAFHIKPQCK